MVIAQDIFPVIIFVHSFCNNISVYMIWKLSEISRLNIWYIFFLHMNACIYSFQSRQRQKRHFLFVFFYIIPVTIIIVRDFINIFCKNMIFCYFSLCICSRYSSILKEVISHINSRNRHIIACPKWLTISFKNTECQRWRNNFEN